MDAVIVLHTYTRAPSTLACLQLSNTDEVWLQRFLSALRHQSASLAYTGPVKGAALLMVGTGLMFVATEDYARRAVLEIFEADLTQEKLGSQTLMDGVTGCVRYLPRAHTIFHCTFLIMVHTTHTCAA